MNKAIKKWKRKGLYNAAKLNRKTREPFFWMRQMNGL